MGIQSAPHPETRRRASSPIVEPLTWTRSVAPELWCLWGPAMSVLDSMPSCHEPSGVTTPLSVHLDFQDLATVRTVHGI